MGSGAAGHLLVLLLQLLAQGESCSHLQGFRLSDDHAVLCTWSYSCLSDSWVWSMQDCIDMAHLLLQLLTAREMLLQRVSILLIFALCLSYPCSLQFHVPAMELIGAVQDGVFQGASESIVWLCRTVSGGPRCAG